MLQRIDIFYLLLRFVILKDFFKSNLNILEEKFVNDNIKKHRLIYWIVFLSLFLIFPGVFRLEEQVRIGLLTGLLGPVMVLGTAWFQVSFGGTPVKLIDIAMSVTFWMYLSFKLSFVTMCIALISVTPFFFWPIWLLIMCAVFFACEKYDTADSLKSGLDEAQLRHSRAAIRYYRQQGFDSDTSEE